jgi:hypothetical protein
MRKTVFTVCISLIVVASVSLLITGTFATMSTEALQRDTTQHSVDSPQPLLTNQTTAADDSSDDMETSTSHSEPGESGLIAEETSSIDIANEEAINVSDEPAIIGEEIGYTLQMSESNHHVIKGSATSTIGDIQFDSKLLPSNEVKLTLHLKEAEGKPLEFTAYFDLANFVMELDGGNSVLDEEHKELLRTSSARLTAELIEQFEGYDVPEHGFMLIQMLSYWSNSPKGFVHEKHVAVSR